MPQYQAIEEYLGVVAKLCGKRDKLLMYLISMAIVHCGEQGRKSNAGEHRAAS